MTRKFEFLKRPFSVLFASTLMIGLLFVAGCGSDDEPAPEEYEIPGTYTFAEAILQTPITIGPVNLPAGTPITDQMAGGLLAAANCTDPANGAVVLSADNKLYFTCLTESTADTQAGTWALSSAKDKLTLNLSVPAPLALSIDDLMINEVSGEISGTIYNFPLTPDLIAGFLQPLIDGGAMTQEQADAILAGLPAATLVDVDIAFDKES